MGKTLQLAPLITLYIILSGSVSPHKWGGATSPNDQGLPPHSLLQDLPAALPHHPERE